MKPTALTPERIRRVRRSCTCFHLRQAARAVTRVFDETLAPAGLRATQFSLMMVLAHLETATVSELAQALIMDRTTLSRNLKPLEQGGWIRTAPGRDRRTRTLSLTARGRKALEKALPLWEQAQNAVLKRLGKPRWSGLMEHLGAAASLLNPY